MSKYLLLFTFLLLCRSAAGQDLTVMEARWLAAGAPVIGYAREAGLPLDIIVQPQANPGAVPLALGFANGRCKLVFSMRGNPQAEAVLQTVPPAQRALMIEAMMAHEIGHCWRYAQGDWHVLPTGFVERPDAAPADAGLRALSSALRATRREEGYADLAALAWTRQHHADHYRAVYQWMVALRTPQGAAGRHSSHSTLSWLRLAGDGNVFRDDASPFAQVAGMWRAGLAGAD
jgi:hypothetical protein